MFKPKFLVSFATEKDTKADPQEPITPETESESISRINREILITSGAMTLAVAVMSLALTTAAAKLVKD